MEQAAIEVRNNVFSDGVIDADEVRQLEEAVYANGVVSMEAASMLFEINDAVTGNPNAPEWEEFFIRAVSDAITASEGEVGTVGSESVTFLIEHVLADDEVDHTERELLLFIRNHATSVTTELDEKLVELRVLTETDIL
jgi:hypothetical protein